MQSILLAAALCLTAAACGDAWTADSDPAASHAIGPYAISAVRPGVGYARFMAIGDMGTGGAGQRTVARAMADKAKADGLDFVLTVGDNFYGSGVSSTDDPAWQAVFENVYTADSLQVPFYATLGNHDHRGNVRAEIDYGQHSRRWSMQAAYYTFTRRLDARTEIQFFALDTTPIDQGSDVSGQLAWLDKALSESHATWKIAFGHHPVFSNGPHGGSAAMLAKVEPILATHRVDLYIAGHDHCLELFKPIHGVSYCVSGGGAAQDNAYALRWTDRVTYAATLGGFTYYRASREELVIEFVRLDGKTQYAQTLVH